MKKVSIIMSVYKEPKEWIDNAVESIVKQTYTDWELIIISDNPEGHKQNNCIKEWATKDNRIKVIYNDKNIGLTSSLNKGLAISNGDYIARMDADDIALSHRFEEQVRFLQRNTNIDVCYSNFNVIGESGEIVIKDAFDREFISTDYLILCNFIAHPTVMFRRKVLDIRQPLYNEAYRTSQDYELWLFLSDAGCKFGYIAESLLLYRHSSQQTGQKNKKPQLANFKRIKREHLLAFLKKYAVLLDSDVADIALLKAIKRINPCIYDKTKYNLSCFSLYYSVSLRKKQYIFRYLFDSNGFIFKLPFKYSIYIFLILFRRNSWPRLEY